MFYKTRKNLKSQKTDTKTILPCGMELSKVDSAASILGSNGPFVLNT